MNKAQIEALDIEMKDELVALAKSESLIHDPITDGVVDADRYLACSPKMLWILKEPWENLKEGEGGGDWSITEYLRNENKIGDKGTWANMAYVTFSVFNNFPPWNEIDYISKNQKVAESLRNIAYININKFPGKSRSIPSQIAAYYRKYRDILLRQISIINPDILIGGSTLTLFLDDLNLNKGDFTSFGSLKFCPKGQRLYIDAYHPGQWAQLSSSNYVDEIVSVIKRHSPVLSAPKSSIVNQIS